MNVYETPYNPKDNSSSRRSAISCWWKFIAVIAFIVSLAAVGLALGLYFNMNTRVKKLFEDHIYEYHDSGYCENGLAYDSKCIYIPDVVQNPLSYEVAQRFCSQHEESNLAEITDDEMFDDVADFVRYWWFDVDPPRTGTSIDLWLGSTYDNNSVTLRNGEVVELTRWVSGYPKKNPGFTHLGITIPEDDGNSDISGIYNENPDSIGAIPLCSYDL